MEKLGKQFNTDKYLHGFLKFYESFMASKQHEPIHFLEIGVFYGASIKMWSAYFIHPDTKIVGADWFKGVQGNSGTFSNPRKAIFENINPRVKYVDLDQGNLEELNALKDTHCDFDFILDDGSHRMKHQQQTFGVLFDKIKSGGYYIIENIQTSFQKGYDVKPDELTTFAMAELLAQKKYPTLAHYTLQNDILDRIEDVKIHKTKASSMTCFIKKR